MALSLKPLPLNNVEQISTAPELLGTISNKRANELFREKYPEGTIYAKGKFGGVSSSKYAVVFEKGGRVYSYYEPNYTALLVRLGVIPETIYPHYH